MLKSITWQQVAVLALMLSATIAAHKMLGEDAGDAAGTFATLVAFLMGRPSDKAAE